MVYQIYVETTDRILLFLVDMTWIQKSNRVSSLDSLTALIFCEQMVVWNTAVYYIQ